MAIGVFGLQVAYKFKRTELMSSNQTHGWFSGNFPTITSTVDRIDFSNDSITASVRSPLSGARYHMSATGNSNYGWFGGGFLLLTGTVSSVDRIDFSNDSGTTSVRGSLTTAKNRSSAVANTNYGWWCGGFFPTSISTVERIDFNNDSATASLRGPLAAARYQAAATGNSNYGWIGGGNLALSTIQRINFLNDFVTASPRGVLLSTARAGLGACGNSNYGWFGGGTAVFAPAANYQSRVDRVDFSNDTTNALSRGSLSAGKYYVTATGNSNYGWFGGGNTTAPAVVSIVDRIDFSNDLTAASPRGPLSQTRYRSTSTSGQGKFSSIKLKKSGSYGWWAGGGAFPGPTAQSRVQRIDFSNDTPTASPRGPLSANTPGGVYGAQATGNSNYGWVIGGTTGFPSLTLSKIDRIDFDNDSVTASVRGYSPVSLLSHVALGNANYGYFGLGPAPGSSYYVLGYRINFSNDTVLAGNKTMSSDNRQNACAFANSNYGYYSGGTAILGGYPPYNSNGRIDFSSDFTSFSYKGSYSVSNATHRSAVANSNYGWVAGGAPGPTSIVERLDYANDDIVMAVRGPLSATKYRQTSTGNSHFGWFGGGYSGSPSVTSRTTVDRISFANDLATASVRGGMVAPAMSKQAAVSNTTR